MSADKGRKDAAGILKKREYERGSHQKDSTHTTMEFETENSLEQKVKNQLTVRFTACSGAQSSSDEFPDRLHKIVGLKRSG